MAADQRPLTDQIVAFGPFRLSVATRLLEKEDKPLHLGSRALDILIALIESAGATISKRELMARVWPNVTVDEGSLRFHVATLRKALGDGRGGARYIVTLAGQGYCFVAPISRAMDGPPPGAELADIDPSQRLPRRLLRMVGRDAAVRAIGQRLEIDRFVSIVGPGGIGKTTVAVAAAHMLAPSFGSDVRFFDLGPVNDPQLLPSVVASKLGLLIQTNDPIPTLITFLRNRRVLLILDSCEHVVEAAAVLAERIFDEAPQVHILVTTREPLRVEGEQIIHLPPLDSPPDDPDLTADKALTYPAARLFVERVVASGRQFELTDADAPVIGELCRRLDGIALAIELAAGRVGAYGLRETAALLDNRLGLLWEGRRTALLRHQTLSATLDWSYDLLLDRERTVLHRLSIFVGAFTLDAARAVGIGGDIGEPHLVAAIESLVTKSLVSADTTLATARFRLLDTTRAYVMGKLIGSGEADETARRHAMHFLSFLREDSAAPSGNNAATRHAEHLSNVRAALEWSFSERGDTRIGISLAASAVHLFLRLSLLTECTRWAERAIAVINDSTRGTRCEMELQSALGLSVMFTKGNSEQVGTALMRAFRLAEELKDEPQHLRVLGRLHIYHERMADFYTSLTFAHRSEAVAASIGDPIGIAAAHSAMGISLHIDGNQAGARKHLDAAMVRNTSPQGIGDFHFGFDYRNRARIALARTLWLQGYPDQAIAVAKSTVDEATKGGHPITICIALIWAVSVYLWSGDLDNAEANITRFIAHADRHSLAPYQAVGLGVKGELSIGRGEGETGIRLLRDALEILNAARYRLLTTTFNIALAQGQILTGRSEEAMATIDDAILSVERNGDGLYMPELLRTKANLLASMPLQENAIQAEEYLMSSLTLARDQSASSWELRTAIDLSQFYFKQGLAQKAWATLAPVHERFTEGLKTADLVAASILLAKYKSAAYHAGSADVVILNSQHLTKVLRH